MCALGAMATKPHHENTYDNSPQSNIISSNICHKIEDDDVSRSNHINNTTTTNKNEKTKQNSKKKKKPRNKHTVRTPPPLTVNKKNRLRTTTNFKLKV